MMKRIIALVLVLVLALSFTACAKKDVLHDKVLTVAMECGYAPYNWTQSSDANGAVQISGSPDYAYGYDVMMAKYLADKIGYDVEIVKSDWDSLPLAVQAGKVDCVIAGQSITSERLQTVDFTTPYYYASIHAVTTKDSAYANAKSLSDLAGATCTSQINTVWYDVCLPQIKDANILPAQEDVPSMFVMLASGKCDLVVCDQPAALGAMAANPDLVMIDLSAEDFVVSEEEINIGISLQKGNTELLNLLNDALSGLTEEDFVDMMNEAIKLSANL